MLFELDSLLLDQKNKFDNHRCYLLMIVVQYFVHLLIILLRYHCLARLLDYLQLAEKQSVVEY